MATVTLSLPNAELPSLAEPVSDPVCERCGGSLERTPSSLSTRTVGLLVQLRCQACGERSWWRLHEAYSPVSQDFEP